MTETESYDFFTQIEDFLSELDTRVSDLARIDFSRIQGEGYYSAREGEEEYARKVKTQFDEFKSFVESAGAKYDFLATTINGEFKKEAVVVTAQRTRVLGALAKLLRT